MNVGELIKALSKFPFEMEIAVDQWSDYAVLDSCSLTVVSGVDQNGWVMRSHPTMSEDNKAREKLYLYLEENTNAS